MVWGAFPPVHGFQFWRWDDDFNVTQNELIQAEFSGELVGRWFSSVQAMRFKPVHWLAGWILHRQFGLNPVAWHGFNLLLHVGVAVGFFLLLRQILARWSGEAATESMIESAAWLAAAAWALHPLRVKSVAWVTASTYPMATDWLLMSFALYLRAHPPGANGFGMKWLLGSWIAAVFAYGTYPHTVSYGLFLIVVDWGYLKCVPSWRSPELWRWLGKMVAFFIPAVAALSATLWVRFFDIGIFSDTPDLGSIGLSERAITALAIVGALLSRLVWFYDLTPNLPHIDLSFGNVVIVVSVPMAVAIVSVVIWIRRRRLPMTAVVWFGFLAISLPCLGFTEKLTWPPDRYSYFSHLVVVVGLAGGGIQICRRTQAPRVMAGLGCLLVLGLLIGSLFQLPMWTNSPTFFGKLVEHPSFDRNPRQAGRACAANVVPV